MNLKPFFGISHIVLFECLHISGRTVDIGIKVILPQLSAIRIRRCFFQPRNKRELVFCFYHESDVCEGVRLVDDRLVDNSVEETHSSENKIKVAVAFDGFVSEELNRSPQLDFELVIGVKS